MVTTVVVDGLALAQELRERMAKEVAALVAAGRRAPCLAVVLVGDDPASASYIKGKRRACERVGMGSVEHKLPADTSQGELLALVAKLNRDDGVDGILVQLPLPRAISRERDRLGSRPRQGRRRRRARSTPASSCSASRACSRARRSASSRSSTATRWRSTGAHAVVIGRSMIVGKPVSLLLQRRNATVTMCHSRTRELAALCRSADVLVAAVGIPRLVKADWIRPGAAVIDVGVTEVDGELVGDVDFDAALGVAGLVTPHRRGVGPMTITMLLHNTLLAHRQRTGA